MGGRKIACILLIVALVAVCIFTWGSVASFSIVLALVIAGCAFLRYKSIENREENDYYSDGN